MSRVIAHIDMDYFYAAIEEREDPSLRDKAVVVCMYSNRGEKGGAVSTCNYIAREAGIHSAMPCQVARSLKPDAVYLPVRKDFYTQVSDRIMEVLRSFADGGGQAFEKISIDEAFIDITRACGGDIDNAADVGMAIKEQIKQSEGLTCSVGVGPNKLIAKMSSSHQKPDGMTIVNEKEVVGFLAGMPVSKLWGIGNVTGEQLAAMGVSTIEQLASRDIQDLINVFGKTKGVWLKNAALGIDESPVKEKAVSDQIGRMASLEHNTRNEKLISSLMRELEEDVFEKVLKRQVMFRTVTVTVIFANFKTVTKARTLNHHIQDRDMLGNICEEVLEQLLLPVNLNVRRLGVRVGDLKESGGQRSLSDFF